MFDIRKIQEQVIYEAVKEKSDDQTAKEIVYGNDALPANKDNASWVKQTMHNLESKFDRETVKEIRMGCQCGYGIDEKLALVKELMSTSSNMDEFANSDKAKAAGLSYKDDTLYLQFHFCPCPMLAEVDRLETDTRCQCTIGYSKVLFEKAFGCAVDVELLKSIKAGGDSCLMKILPQNAVFK